MAVREPKPLQTLLAGMVAGGGATALMHPLDSLRVIAQRDLSAGFRQQITSMLNAGLFAGVLPSVIAQAATCALCFSIQDSLENAVHRDFRVEGLSGAALSGTLTGILMAPIVGPLELLKCRAQSGVPTSGIGNNASSSTVAMRTSIGSQCTALNINSRWPAEARAFVTSSVLMDNVPLYRGLTATALRCGLGNAAFFGVIHLGRELRPKRFSNYKMSSSSSSSSTLPHWQWDMFVGAMSGLAYWTVACPFDLIKSRQQTMDSSAGARSILQEGRLILKASGGSVTGLWRGFGMAAMRTVPMQALVMLLYTSTLRGLDINSNLYKQ